jgi:hypothetical protein
MGVSGTRYFRAEDDRAAAFLALLRGMASFRIHSLLLLSLIISLLGTSAWADFGARVTTSWGALNLRREIADGVPGQVIAKIPRDASVEIDEESLASALAHAPESARERFFSQNGCGVFGAAWKGIASSARLEGQSYHYVKIRYSSEDGTLMSGYVALEYLRGDETLDCKGLFQALVRKSLPQKSACAVECLWKSERAVDLVHSIAGALAHLPSSEDDAQAFEAQANSLCETHEETPTQEPATAGPLETAPREMPAELDADLDSNQPVVCETGMDGVASQEDLEKFASTMPQDQLAQVIERWGGDRAAALRALVIASRYGASVIPSPHPADGIPSAADLAWMERTLEHLPSHLSRAILDVFQQFTIMQVAIAGDTEGYAGGGKIQLAKDSDFLAPGHVRHHQVLKVDARASLLLHEVGHLVDSALPNVGNQGLLKGNLSHSPEWVAIVSSEHQPMWPWNRDFYCGKAPTGGCDPREVFAEVFAHYLLTPSLLKASAPRMYAFMHDRVFDGWQTAGFDACPGGIFRQP